MRQVVKNDRLTNKPTTVLSELGIYDGPKGAQSPVSGPIRRRRKTDMCPVISSEDYFLRRMNKKIVRSPIIFFFLHSAAFIYT